jgi:hypothetical protein
MRIAAGQHLVRRFNATARKHQGARGEINLAVAHHHEDFHAALPVTQQHDG